MFGLAVLVVFGVYLLISFLVVRWAIGYARKNGKSAKRWGWGAAFVMYSIVFWDWIPTVVVHQYYCAKDSGFWVYKTLDQWKAENPGGMETLVANKGTPSTHQGDEENYSLIEIVNQRFNRITISSRLVSFLPVHRYEQQLVDVKNEDLLARQIGFGSYDRSWGGLKFWTSIQHCSGGREEMVNFGNFVNQFKGAKE